MVTNQDSNWTLFYARSSRNPSRFWKVTSYQGRCWACECEGNRKGRKECAHIRLARAGELTPATLRESAPAFRRVTVSAEMRERSDLLDVG
jgi:hypothetical protein